MKWFLLVIVIGMSVQLFRQNSQISALNLELAEARVTITGLQNKPKPPPLSYDAFGTNRPHPPGAPAAGGRGATLLDVPAKTTHR